MFASEVSYGVNTQGVSCLHTSQWFAGKKDTPVAAVQAVSYTEGVLPPGLDRVTSILAGRITLPVMDVSHAMSRSFSTSAGRALSDMTGSWRGFAALTTLRRHQ